ASVSAGAGQNSRTLGVNGLATGAVSAGFGRYGAPGRELYCNSVSNAADWHPGTEHDRGYRRRSDPGIALGGRALVTADHSAVHSRADFWYRYSSSGSRRRAGWRIPGSDGRVSGSGGNTVAFRLGSGPENQSFEQLIGSLGPATNQTITVKMVTN